jgi:adenine-specific DNA-methyltransferase
MVSKRSSNSTKLDFSKFPTTRFYGSKRKILPWLYQEFSKHNFNTALDGFGGTSSVTFLLAQMGKKVSYNDCFNFNTISAEAIFTKNKDKYIPQIYSTLKSVNPFNGVITQNFKEIFFTNEENQWLDGCITRINDIKTEQVKNIFFYALFQACLKKRPFNLFHRSNLNLRLNDVERSFGNLSTWNKSFQRHIEEILNELLSLKFHLDFQPKILTPKNVLEVKNGFDFVYLDPPYLNGGNYADDYNRRYHFLEGIVNYNDWQYKLEPKSKIKEFKSPAFIKEWNDPKKFKDLLFQLVQNHKKSIVVLSYADNGVPDIRTLKNFFKQSFSNYKIVKKEVNYALSKSMKTEIIFVGLPK